MGWIERKGRLEEQLEMQIVNKIRELYPNSYGSDRPIKELARLMSSNEGGEYVKRVAITRSSSNGIIVATNVRLALVRNHGANEIIAYNEIRSINHETKLLSRYSGKITVSTSGYRTVIFDGLGKEEIQDFVDVIRACIANQASRKPIEQIKTQIENRVHEISPHESLFHSGLDSLALLMNLNESEERVERVARCFSRFLIATNVRLVEIHTHIEQEIIYEQIRSIKYETEYPNAGITLLTTNDETMFFDLDVILDRVDGTHYSQSLAEYVKACVNRENAAKEWRKLYTTTITAALYNLRGTKYDTREVTDAALRGTSGEIMRKYGLSEQEMMEIVSKWSSSL